MTDPLVPRPAATVMLVRDTAQGIKVFLMRRHSAMDFVAGVMVFPVGVDNEALRPPRRLRSGPGDVRVAVAVVDATAGKHHHAGDEVHRGVPPH